jgi:hypothetical protein
VKLRPVKCEFNAQQLECYRDMVEYTPLALLCELEELLKLYRPANVKVAILKNIFYPQYDHRTNKRTDG